MKHSSVLRNSLRHQHNRSKPLENWLRHSSLVFSTNIKGCHRGKRKPQTTYPVEIGTDAASNKLTSTIKQTDTASPRRSFSRTSSRIISFLNTIATSLEKHGLKTHPIACPTYMQPARYACGAGIGVARPIAQKVGTETEQRKNKNCIQLKVLLTTAVPMNSQHVFQRVSSLFSVCKYAKENHGALVHEQGEKHEAAPKRDIEY